jgi:hypothetical protein
MPDSAAPISLIKSETIAKKILIAMHLPADAPELHPARPGHVAIAAAAIPRSTILPPFFLLLAFLSDPC